MTIRKDNSYFRMLSALMTSGMAFLLNYGIMLVLTPYITNRVGIEAYGFVSLAKQFSQYAAVITTALNSFATRFITVDHHRNDLKGANRYFSSVFWGDLALGSGIFTAAVVAICFLEHLLQIPQQLVTDVKLLFFFVFLTFWVTTVCTVFSSGAFIKDRLDTVGLFRGLSYLTEALVLVFAYLLLDNRVFYVGVALLAASLVLGGANLWLCRRLTPELRVTRSVSLKAIRRLTLAGIWNSINAVGSLLNDGLDLLVCNTMLSALAMGQLAIAKCIYSIFSGSFLLVNQVVQPMLLRSYAQDDRPRLLRQLRGSMKLSALLTNLGFAGFFALGRVYYTLWIPGQDIETVYRLTVISILTAVAVSSMQPLYYIYTLTVRNKLPCFITVLGGLCNVAGMYLLIRHTDLGVYAVVLTTLAVMAVISFVTNPLNMAHVLQLPWYTFYPDILRNLVSCLVLTLLFRLMAGLYLPGTWAGLVLCAAVYAVIGTAVHLAVVFRPKELRRAVRLFRGRRNAAG